MLQNPVIWLVMSLPDYFLSFSAHCKNASAHQLLGRLNCPKWPIKLIRLCIKWYLGLYVLRQKQCV